nr:hypothetical protein Iba_chr08aCG12160 [Ipomoea batatas]
MDDGLEKYDSGKGDWDDGGQSAMISETVPLLRLHGGSRIEAENRFNFRREVRNRLVKVQIPKHLLDRYLLIFSCQFKETEQIDRTVFRDFGETQLSDVIESREDFIAENSLAEEKSFHRDSDTALPIQNLPLQTSPSSCGESPSESGTVDCEDALEDLAETVSRSRKYRFPDRIV